MMKRIVLLILVLFFFEFFSVSNVLSGQSIDNIIKNNSLRVCVEAGYVPFEMEDKNGKIIGFDIDLAKLMAKSLGVELQILNVSRDIIIDELVANKCDVIMSGMSITLERNLRINFTDPYMIVGQTVLINKKHLGKINDFKDLNSINYTIATKSGVTAVEAINKYLTRAKLKLFDNEIKAVMDVVEGKSDAFVYDSPFNTIFYPQYKDKLFLLDKPFTHEFLAIALRKDDPDFLNWLNNFIKIIKGDGTFDALYNKWFIVAKWWEEVK